MFAKWLEEYQRLSGKLRFLSQLAAFLLSLFAVLSLYNIAYLFRLDNYAFNQLFEIHFLFPAVIFHLVIFVTFAAKFALLFFKSKRFLYLNHILWIIGLIVLANYWYFSILEPIPFGLYSMEPPSNFRHASGMFDFVGVWYLLLSLPVRFLTLIIALIKSR